MCKNVRYAINSDDAMQSRDSDTRGTPWMLTEERTTATDGPTAGMPSNSRDAYNSRNARKRWKLQYQKGRNSDRDSGNSRDSTLSRDSKDANSSKNSISSWDASSSMIMKKQLGLEERQQQAVTKRCRLSWLTNSALVYEPKCGGGEELLNLWSTTTGNRTL
jgi:hypothetical protein